MGEKELRLPRQVYRLRTLGLALGFVCVGAVFRERGAPPAAWALVAFHGVIWPHVAWYHARMSADPHRAERLNLLWDSVIGGLMVPLMHFALLPCVLIVAMLSMDKIGWGWRFLGRCCGAMLTAGVLITLLMKPPVPLETTFPMMIASIPLMVLYPFAVAWVSERSGRLARERNKAIEEMVALREQLAHIARVGTLGEMAAGLAHELNQPLTAIHLEATSALTGPPPTGDEVRDTLTRIADQSMRAGEIVRRMRAFARRGQKQREAVDIGSVVHETLALLDHDLRLNGVHTEVTMESEHPMAHVDRIEMQQVLVNLIRNAIEAMSSRTAGDRRLRIRTEANSLQVRVSVSDNGGGISPAIEARLFHPFQTTKAAGMGLGLSIVQSLVEAQGGRVAAGPHPEGGALFYFDVPSA